MLDPPPASLPKNAVEVLMNLEEKKLQIRNLVHATLLWAILNQKGAKIILNFIFIWNMIKYVDLKKFKIILKL